MGFRVLGLLWVTARGLLNDDVVLGLPGNFVGFGDGAEVGCSVLGHRRSRGIRRDQCLHREAQILIKSGSVCCIE